ncbi:MAG: methyltransferase domain-containing protein, partial [Luteimonas sp.]
PQARVIAMDLALPMLQRADTPRDWRRPFSRRPSRICADARALPLADDSIDVLFSNLCLQWVDDLPDVLAGFRRVLKPGGLLLCSTFGPATLQELHDAFARADAAPHVSPFASIAQFGDALMRSGFRDPVLDRDTVVRGYDDLPSLMRELRALGATNALSARRRTLTGRVRFRSAAAAYDVERGADGLLPASWETITAMAWAPEAGAPIRAQGVDEVRVSVSDIPTRRRP